MSQDQTNEKFRILSLDGGGIRGYLTAMILEKMEAYLNEKNGETIPIGQRFDLIAGTSTGAIIGGMLAIGKTAAEIRKIYEKDISEIFGHKKNRLYSMVRPKYDSKILDEKAKIYFNELTFADVKTHLLVTAVDITTAKPRFYKSKYFKRNLGREAEHLSDVIAASSSAPTYFNAKRNMEYSDLLTDGGIVANNPAMVALIDALQFEVVSKRGTKPPKDINDILLLSVGTGDMCEVSYDPEKFAKAGALYGAINIVELLTQSQSRLTAFEVAFLMKRYEGAVYYRFNPKLSTKIALDDADKKDMLKNLADITIFEEKFLDEHF